MSPETFWLLAWSLGGLLVMSCIPSKRVDRIFPIVPPLCLLLAAVVGEFRRQDKLRTITDRLCIAAIILACVGTTGYVANRIAVARREERDAFAEFGRDVMKKAAENGWRYSVLGGDDEGMALYVRRTEFAWPDEAAADWNAGKLEALVVADDDVAGRDRALRGSQAAASPDFKTRGAIQEALSSPGPPLRSVNACGVKACSTLRRRFVVSRPS